MKVLFFLTVIIIVQNCESQHCNCDGFFIPDNKLISVYSDSDAQKVVYRINNDSANEIYYNFSILERKDDFLKVIPSSGNDTLKKAGWIKNEYVGIYSSNYNSALHLYAKPDLRSNIVSTIKEYFPVPLTIISCSGTWLYVSVKLNNKVYKGWMAKEDQCANVYSTCN